MSYINHPHDVILAKKRDYEHKSRLWLKRKCDMIFVNFRALASHLLPQVCALPSVHSLDLKVFQNEWWIQGQCIIILSSSWKGSLNSQIWAWRRRANHVVFCQHLGILYHWKIISTWLKWRTPTKQRKLKDETHLVLHVQSRGVKLILIYGPHPAHFDPKWAGPVKHCIITYK